MVFQKDALAVYQSISKTRAALLYELNLFRNDIVLVCDELLSLHSKQDDLPARYDISVFPTFKLYI